MWRMFYIVLSIPQNTIMDLNNVMTPLVVDLILNKCFLIPTMDQLKAKDFVSLFRFKSLATMAKGFEF